MQVTVQVQCAPWLFHQLVTYTLQHKFSDTCYCGLSFIPRNVLLEHYQSPELFSVLLRLQGHSEFDINLQPNSCVIGIYFPNVLFIYVYLCRNSFPVDHQFSCVTRYIMEQAQLPNIKVSKVQLHNQSSSVVSVETYFSYLLFHEFIHHKLNILKILLHRCTICHTLAIVVQVYDLKCYE